MIRRPPRSTRTDTLFPYTTLFRSDVESGVLLGEILRLEVIELVVRVDADLGQLTGQVVLVPLALEHAALDLARTHGSGLYDHLRVEPARLLDGRVELVQGGDPADPEAGSRARSEERRVGKECVHKGRSRV